MQCPCCYSECVPLGTLGMLRWFRCRGCGMGVCRKIRRKVRPKASVVAAFGPLPHVATK